MNRSTRRLAITVAALALTLFLHTASADGLAPCEFCSWQCQNYTPDERDGRCEDLCDLSHGDCATTDDDCGSRYGELWGRMYCYPDAGTRE